MAIFGKSKFKGIIGNYRPCCGGSFLISHVKGDYIYATLTGILLPILLFAVFEGESLFQVSAGLSIFFYLFPLLAFIFAIVTWCTEPGIIPHGTDHKNNEDSLCSQDEKTLSTIMMSIKNGKMDNLNKSLTAYPQLLKMTNKEGRTLLHIAALYGNLDNVKSLLSFSIDVNAKDLYGLTPLHYAFFEKKDDISIYLYNYIYNHLLNEKEESNSDSTVRSSSSNFIPDGELTLSNQYYIIQREYINEVYEHMGADLAEDPRYMYSLSSSSSKYMRSFIVNGHIESLRYCSSCNLYIPPRAFHCRHCNTCILKYDHHCPWMSTCIGLRNKKFFIFMLFFCSLSLLMDIIASCTIYYYYVFQNINWSDFDSTLFYHDFLLHLYTLFFVAFALVFVYPVCRLTVYNIMLICREQTTNESLLHNNKKQSPYSHGVYQNLIHELFSPTPPSLVAYNEFSL